MNTAWQPLSHHAVQRECLPAQLTAIKRQRGRICRIDRPITRSQTIIPHAAFDGMGYRRCVLIPNQIPLRLIVRFFQMIAICPIHRSTNKIATDEIEILRSVQSKYLGYDNRLAISARIASFHPTMNATRQGFRHRHLGIAARIYFRPICLVCIGSNSHAIACGIVHRRP